MLTALTGEPVEDVLTGVAEDAGLENTALQPVDAFGLPEPASAGYVNEYAVIGLQIEGVDVEPLGDVSDYTASWGGSGGSMYSAVEDLGQWTATGFGNAFLPADLAAARLDSKPIDVGDYGLGVLTLDGGWYGHPGEILGWESIAFYQPDTGAIFVALVNESVSLLLTAEAAVAAFPDLAAFYEG